MGVDATEGRVVGFEFWLVLSFGLLLLSLPERPVATTTREATKDEDEESIDIS